MRPPALSSNWHAVYRAVVAPSLVRLALLSCHACSGLSRNLSRGRCGRVGCACVVWQCTNVSDPGALPFDIEVSGLAGQQLGSPGPGGPGPGFVRHSWHRKPAGFRSGGFPRGWWAPRRAVCVSSTCLEPMRASAAACLPRDEHAHRGIVVAMMAALLCLCLAPMTMATICVSALDCSTFGSSRSRKFRTMGLLHDGGQVFGPLLSRQGIHVSLRCRHR